MLDTITDVLKGIGKTAASAISPGGSALVNLAWEDDLSAQQVATIVKHSSGMDWFRGADEYNIEVKAGKSIAYYPLLASSAIENGTLSVLTKTVERRAVDMIRIIISNQDVVKTNGGQNSKSRIIDQFRGEMLGTDEDTKGGSSNFSSMRNIRVPNHRVMESVVETTRTELRQLLKESGADVDVVFTMLDKGGKIAGENCKPITESIRLSPADFMPVGLTEDAMQRARMRKMAARKAAEKETKKSTSGVRASLRKAKDEYDYEMYDEKEEARERAIKDLQSKAYNAKGKQRTKIDDKINKIQNTQRGKASTYYHTAAGIVKAGSSLAKDAAHSDASVKFRKNVKGKYNKTSEQISKIMSRYKKDTSKMADESKTATSEIEKEVGKKFSATDEAKKIIMGKLFDKDRELSKGDQKEKYTIDKEKRDKRGSIITSKDFKMDTKSIEKLNDMEPTTAVVSFYYESEGGSFQETQLLIAVKASLHVVPSEAMIDEVSKVISTERPFFRFIQWYTGEIDFWSEFVLKTDQVASYFKNDRTDTAGMFSQLMQNAKNAKMQGAIKSVSSKHGARLIPTTTMVLTTDEVKGISRLSQEDLMQPKTAKRFLDTLGIMNLYIIDEASNILFKYNHTTMNYDRSSIPAEEGKNKENDQLMRTLALALQKR